jgi:dTDP-L-rhamnose 4-epimerase
LDVLHPQVHRLPERTNYMNQHARIVKGDMRDLSVLDAVLEDAEVVFHLAALTGGSQSMYNIHEYMDMNVMGTASLLQLLSQNRRHVRKLILASSRAVYGERLYDCHIHGEVEPPPRTLRQLKLGQWELRCPLGGCPVRPTPTSENKQLNPASLYAITKLHQEQTCLTIGQSYNVPVVALRLFNVYGPRQSLGNPYSNIVSIFTACLINGRSPEVYEDGCESRDFIHVKDVVQAFLLAMERDEADGQILNVGSGAKISLLELATTMSERFGDLPPIVTGKSRAGDIRHCYADLTRIKRILGFEPQVTLRAGLDEWFNHVSGRQCEDLLAVAEQELMVRGLFAQVDK